jgi:hypothetical protein
MKKNLVDFYSFRSEALNESSNAKYSIEQIKDSFDSNFSDLEDYYMADINDLDVDMDYSVRGNSVEIDVTLNSAGLQFDVHTFKRTLLRGLEEDLEGGRKMFSESDITSAVDRVNQKLGFVENIEVNFGDWLIRPMVRQQPGGSLKVDSQLETEDCDFSSADIVTDQLCTLIEY